MQQETWSENLVMRAIKPVLVIASLLSLAAGWPAQSETGHRISSASARHRWKQDHWEIRAEPGSICVAIAQYGLEPKGFWGFIQTGTKLSSLEIFFDSGGPAQPKTIQMSYNDGGMNTHSARVENWAGMDSYVVPMGPNLLADYRTVTEFAAYSDGKLIWSEKEFHMDKVEDAMLKCWEWQLDH